MTDFSRLNTRRRFRFAFGACIAGYCCFLMSSSALAQNATLPAVKVFVLAGQSNMEGKARVSLIKYQLTQPTIAGMFKPLVDKSGNWRTRGDVSIKFLDRAGPLTVGYGSRDRIGPELGFGHTVGDHYEQHVLLIKTAWGGKSLFRDFRPPSAGTLGDDELQQILEREQKRRPTRTLQEVKSSFGFYYREMIADVAKTLGNVEETFPELRGRELELSGWVWFQGWNDMVNAEYTAAYAENLVHLVRDVRRDLKAPELPVVVGVMGVGGMTDLAEKHQRFREAQAKIVTMPEFQGNVAIVETGRYWDLAAQRIFDKGWRDNMTAWERVGSDRPYHYLGSARTYWAIGRGFGRAMLALSEPAAQEADQQKGVRLVAGRLVEDDVVPELFEATPDLSDVETEDANVAAPRFYDPEVTEIAGWTLRVEPKLMSEQNREVREKAFEALANHLQRIRYIVPQQQLAVLQTLPIWIELNNERIGGMQYHPGRGWLVENGYDPRLVNHVHIPKARELYNPKMWAKHPYVVLHELAHSFHDQKLGFDNPEIAAAYEEAKESGKYERVMLYTGEKVRHYGLNNPMEYFAESTEAYFGVNDFYPFVRAELREHDPRMFQLLEKFWGPVAE